MCCMLALALACQTSVVTRVPEPRVAVTLAPAITRVELEAHVRFLAADEQKGRATGTPEAERCARYIALVFKTQGLEPAGDEGSFLQTVALVRTRATALPEFAWKAPGGARAKLALGADYDFTARPISVEDLRVVVVRSEADVPRAPDPRLALFLDGNAERRKAWLAAAGVGDGGGFGLLLVPGNDKRGRERALENVRPRLQRARDVSAAPQGPVRVHGEFLERLRRGECATLSFEAHVAREDVRASNVVARIRGRGTDAEARLAEEAVVFTAHYDHLHPEHTGASAKGPDQIWNGADDDASGTAAVLELAGAFRGGPPPARTLVFALVTGEEVGLLGTEEYLDRPVVPLDRTVANLNFEMIGRPDPLVGGAGRLWFTGFELSNLGAAFAEAGIAVLADPYPNEHYFERSDNIAFVRRGVVGQTFSTFNGHADYHQPSDEADKLDYAHLEACTQAGFAASRLVADGRIRPAWLEGRAPKRR